MWKVGKEVLGIKLGVVLHCSPRIWDVETGRAVVYVAESLHCYWKSETSSGPTGCRDTLLKNRKEKKPPSLVEIEGRAIGWLSTTDGMLGFSG